MEKYDDFGRSAGYSFSREGLFNNETIQTYTPEGRLASVGFDSGDGFKNFTYAYLLGSSLPESLTYPNGIIKSIGYESHRDLMTSLLYQRNGATLVSCSQTSDALGRPVTRSQQRLGEATPRHDAYTYNDRSELTGATLNTDQYSYVYDNIGNRQVATEQTGTIILNKGYVTNNLNQYTRTISPSFIPQYDADGNQILILTPSGIWQVEYNADNRPAKFTRSSDNTIVTCAYDYAGRRFYKNISRGSMTPVIEYYVYRNYLQIAALNGQTNDPELIHSLTWDPLYPEATRPLSLHKNNRLYLYAHDFNKNVTELFSESGSITESYDYDPYGKITVSTGPGNNPIMFSSEYYDDELNLVYYNYRHYNPNDGRWLSRDSIEEDGGLNLYSYVSNCPVPRIDILGMEDFECKEGNLGQISNIRYELTFFYGAARFIVQDPDSYIRNFIWDKAKGEAMEGVGKLSKWAEKVKKSWDFATDARNTFALPMKAAGTQITSLANQFWDLSIEIDGECCVCRNGHYYKQDIKSGASDGGIYPMFMPSAKLIDHASINKLVQNIIGMVSRAGGRLRDTCDERVRVNSED